MDIIKDLQELAFASRLKRLSERLARDVSSLYKKLDVDFEARWFTILHTLNRKSPLAVTKLAQMLGLTHTAINQLSKEMLKKGLLFSSKGKQDERQRLLSISDKGKEVAHQLAPIWEEIRAATKDLIYTTNSDLLSTIETIEKQLDEQNMYERVWIRLKGSPPGEVKIFVYNPAMKKHFKSLNYEWLEQYFQVEKSDAKLLSNPRREILNKGGVIFFASVDDKVVGTCALIKHRDGSLELAKMAVTKKFQHRGIGKKLIEAVIERAGEMGPTQLYLLTSNRLKSANRLYEKIGFRRIDKSPLDKSRYHRTTYAMKLDIETYQNTSLST